MKLIVLTLLALVASTAATRYSSQLRPRPETNPKYLHSEERSSEALYGFGNNFGRLPSVILDRVPGAEDLLAMPLETLERRTDEEIVNTLHEFCNVAISTDAIHPTIAPSKGQINVRFLTKQVDTSVPLTQPQVEMPNLFQGNDNVILITGTKLNTFDENSALSKLHRAYECRGGVNFIHIDLGHHMDTLRTWMYLDTEQVGTWIGEFISELAKNVPVRSIHLIGHSVGAHVAGAAARRFTELTGHVLPRITALDPAMICYRKPQTISGLQKGDAEFVDVIHTSSYGLGTMESIGDIDFYPNGPITLQPGTRNLVASHNRAMEYFAETVLPGNEENFKGYRCNSMQNLRTHFCQLKEIPMGFSTPTDVRGNFFLPTKQVYPYGHNAVPGVQKMHCREY